MRPWRPSRRRPPSWSPSPATACWPAAGGAPGRPAPTASEPGAGARLPIFPITERAASRRCASGVPAKQRQHPETPDASPAHPPHFPAAVPAAGRAAADRLCPAGRRRAGHRQPRPRRRDPRPPGLRPGPRHRRVRLRHRLSHRHLHLGQLDRRGQVPLLRQAPPVRLHRQDRRHLLRRVRLAGLQVRRRTPGAGRPDADSVRPAALLRQHLLRVAGQRDRPRGHPGHRHQVHPEERRLGPAGRLVRHARRTGQGHQPRRAHLRHQRGDGRRLRGGRQRQPRGEHRRRPPGAQPAARRLGLGSGRVGAGLDPGEPGHRQGRRPPRLRRALPRPERPVGRAAARRAPVDEPGEPRQRPPGVLRQLRRHLQRRRQGQPVRRRPQLRPARPVRLVLRGEVLCQLQPLHQGRQRLRGLAALHRRQLVHLRPAVDCPGMAARQARPLHRRRQLHPEPRRRRQRPLGEPAVQQRRLLLLSRRSANP
ncbi:putative Uncharacterized 50.6 kDa protein in the 5'region of gyrA and gyrB [Pseudomonas sp. OF001]|nr:putative Uncharacterized 50.6 kDa protein in the 5'region of gyrA and gyrB [Pseudomonas sp. OF001]